MTNLPPCLKSLPIINLAIPGSHNTMTYTIERNNDVGPDESKYLRLLGKYFGILLKPLIFNWSVTQYDTITEQLNGGIRYLDFRLAKKSNNDIYFLHGLFGDEITKYLYEISIWLNNHPGEKLIIDCQHFYLFNKCHHNMFVDKLKNIFNHKICPSTMDLTQITIDMMNDKSYQLIIIYRNDICNVEIDFWPSNLWPTPWPNTVNPHKLIDFLNTRLKTKLNDAGFVSQCLLTPNKSYIFKHICGSLHRDLATLCRTTSDNWIENNCPGYGGLNIVITDYVSYQNFLFSKIVIQRNSVLVDNNIDNDDKKNNLYLNEKQNYYDNDLNCI
ncbi:hypothetical protein HCN44_006848 [Aphidius gifuensis]|uniref:Phosphatidylinositol-specific phospholipase C X domain-containing protein n=2 Tax=Aphidius gifuensis TaxID=684658 RepID=A0A834XZJ0_APHGI|nr:hypothetical protein HCN44_006848 [Aphidius gifuensis]